MLADEIPLKGLDRAWLLRVRGTWLTNAQRRRLTLLVEVHLVPRAARRRDEYLRSR